MSLNEFELSKYKPIPVLYELRYSILSKIRKEEDVLSLIPDIDGREETKKDIIRAILSGTSPFLVSEEGTGKTRLAKSLAKLLFTVPAIKGCPYHDDPKGGKGWLCSRCAESEDPAEEYGIEFISPRERFSRIQGNEYTNFAKILGLKDIQVIREGKSPTDPHVFTGTGIFRGNRGIVFVDELPAIPTNVQVLFHPILEEKKVILEEYGLEHKIDIFLVATGNPEGFSHSYKIPRPLLDRLELIYMAIPEEDIEKEIMLKEKLRIYEGYYEGFKEKSMEKLLPNHQIKDWKRKCALPWWIIEVIKKAVSYTRKCPNVEKGASIRGGSKAVDHTYSSVEMRYGAVANIKDACSGIKLALRGRIIARPDIVDFSRDTTEAFKKTDLIIEDIMRYAIKEVGKGIIRGEDESIGEEIGLLVENLSFEGFASGNILSEDSLRSIAPVLFSFVNKSEVLKEKLLEMDKMASKEVKKELMNEKEILLAYHPEKLNLYEHAEYLFSALEILANIYVYNAIIKEYEAKKIFFVPRIYNKKF